MILAVVTPKSHWDGLQPIGARLSGRVDLPQGQPVVRAARASDAVRMAEIIAPYADAGVMLHKTPADLVAMIDQYRVATIGGRVMACGGIRFVNQNTVEIVGLAVDRDAQGMGAGAALMEVLHLDAREQGGERLYALTMESAFFERFGYRKGSVSEVPEKFALDCASCSRRVGCREQMVILD